MFRISAFLAATILVCASAQAAPPATTTMTVTNATGTLGLSGATVTGPATFTNGIPNGTFSATVSITSITGSNVTVPFTVKSTADQTSVLSGSITLPASLLLGGGTGTGSATTSGGTGTYAGDTYSFPTLAGTGSLSGTTITLSFSGAGTLTTGGGGGGTTTSTPAITHVWDSASNSNNIAQGSIFIVKGANLCPSGTTFYNVPRPTVGTDGVKITFTPTSGGSGTDALLWYEYNPSGTCQLAGILPSSIATGNYNVTVTNGSVSAPVATTVVASKFTLFTQDNSGSGLATIQNFVSATEYDLNRFTSGSISGTPISPAHPGQAMIAYGTGMGPLAGGDNSPSPAYDFSTHGVTVQAIVGGMTLPVAYAGRAGYAGEDQVNFTLPANVPTGCAVSLQISVDGKLSNSTFIAIAPDANSNACVAPNFTTSQLQALDNGGTFTVGSLVIDSFSETISGVSGTFASIGGGFIKYSGFQFATFASTGTSSTNTQGACTVTTATSSGSSVVSPPAYTWLDAGNITVTGPSGSGLTNQALTETNTTVNDVKEIAYSLLVGSSILPGSVTGNIVAGQYTFNAAGGADVGKFSGSITVGAPIVVTGGLPTTVNRRQPLPLSWTGGNATDPLEIVGTAGSVSNGVTTSTTFICTTTAGAGSFTVPTSVLSQMPAASGTNGGTLLEISTGNLVQVPMPLTAGGNLNLGIITAASGVASTPTFQ
jgi:uncharacterized protein (TIGR03437 family)